MGCGQSKIGSIYPKNKKNKSNGSKKNGDSIRSASIEQKNGNGNAKGNKTNNNGVEVNRNEEQNGTVEVKGQAKKKPVVPGGGPLLQQAEISTSQLDFFRMLDEKIENGPDYDESLDTVSRAERVSSFLRRWELASVSWSSVAETNDTSPSDRRNRNTTILTNSTSPANSNISTPPAITTARANLSAKDREGMRNIVGGRPESAPIFTRNANRVDGLRESHCASPNMPRHVLESITQSPTQSLKNATPPTASPPNISNISPNISNMSPNISNITANMSQSNVRGYQDPYSSPCTEYNANQASNKLTKVHQCPRNPVNGEYVTQQALYREQYLQQTGIIAIPSQYSGASNTNTVLRGNPYVQQFQIANSQRFSNTTPRKRAFDAAQTT